MKNLKIPDFDFEGLFWVLFFFGLVGTMLAGKWGGIITAIVVGTLYVLRGRGW